MEKLRNSAFLSFFLMVFLFNSAVSPAFADLKPENVAVIATAGNEDSLGIARHYALARKIPAKNVFLLREEYGGWISRENWENKLRPELRKWLLDRPEITCVVCCWNVPLKIGALTMTSPENEARRRLLERTRKSRVHAAVILIATLNAVATEGGRGEAPAIADDVPLKELAAMVEQATKEAQKRLQTLSVDRQKLESRRVQMAFQRFAGLQGILNLIRQQEKATGGASMTDDLKLRTALLNVEIRNITQTLRILNSLPETAPRDAEIIPVLERVGGLMATLQWVDLQLDQMVKNESYASFDSELSAIYLEGYPLMKWIPNYMSFHAVTSEAAPTGLEGVQEVAEKAAEAVNTDPAAWEEEEEEEDEAMAEVSVPKSWTPPPPQKPVLMVARLEAPRAYDVIRLIDDSLKAEAEGLKGAVYLDARGPRPGGERQVGSYEKTDQSLHDLATRLKEHTELEVILDEKGGLLKPEDCPSPAALYCGWYSMGNYRHACEWGQGSVGYHIASMEADSLKGGNGWCPKMLERGVAATLGPTHEPYLSAFPPPEEFLSLVLTGKFTMIECYYYTKMFNSWVITYVGDPLYTPYKNNPQLEMTELPDTLQRFFIKK